MSVSREQVLGIAALARLRLTPGEAVSFAGQLSDILDRVAELDAAGTPPADEDADRARTPSRPDEPGPDPLRIPPADFAPEWADGFFTVPRLAAMEGGADDPGP